MAMDRYRNFGCEQFFSILCAAIGMTSATHRSGARLEPNKLYLDFALMAAGRRA